MAQNEVQADIFLGSLAVFQSERVASAGGRKGGFWGGNSARPTNFGRNLFEFFRTHTANWEMSLLVRSLPRYCGVGPKRWGFQLKICYNYLVSTYTSHIANIVVGWYKKICKKTISWRSIFGWMAESQPRSCVLRRRF